MSLENKFALYREKKLKDLWITCNHIKPLLSDLPKTLFTNSILGYSENTIPIHKIEVGKGPIKILLWSQMHGDESTATKSMFDIFNFIKNEYLSNKQIINLLDKCTLVFIPILNPDGALAYTRENGKGVDLNRDAQQLKSAESQLLMNIVTEFKPHFAFNLHDQSSYHSIANTENSAILSFLAPAADITRKLTKSRREAMKVIVAMYKTLQDYLPNHYGRYSDDFCDTCFGDTIQKMGFPTILIESGYFTGDENREIIRKYHFIALINALFTIASDNLPKQDMYFDIPLNVKRYYDVRITNVLYNNKNTSVAIRYIYIVDKGKFLKVIDTKDTITGNDLDGKLFHSSINAKGKSFDEITNDLDSKLL